MKIKIYLSCIFSILIFIPAVAGTFVTTGASTNWSLAAAWSLVAGSDPDGIPDSNDDVTVNHNVSVNTPGCNVRSLTISSGKTLNIVGYGLNVYGNFSSAGILTGTSTIWFQGSGTIASSTSITSTGLIVRISPGAGTRTIVAGTTFTALNQLILSGTVAGTVINDGNINVVNIFMMDYLTLRNSAIGIITTRTNITQTNGAVLDCSAPGNIFNYSGVNCTNILGAVYAKLSIDNGGTSTIGTKKLLGNITVNTSFNLGANARLNGNMKSIACAGSWTNKGTVAGNDPYNLGTVTFSGSNPTVSRKTVQEVFANVVINCTGTFIPNSSNTPGFTGNFLCNSLTLTAGVFDVNPVGNYTVSLLGNMAVGAGSFVCRNALVNFNGSTAQVITGNPTTFNNITVSNPAGVSTYTPENLLGTLTVNAGTFTSNTADFTLVSDTVTGLTASIAPLISGAVAGNKWVIQRRILAGGSYSTNPFWGDYSSPVANATLADWDNEMLLAGVGGSDTGTFCPSPNSVMEWNDGGPDYKIDSSLVNLVPGFGYTIWTCSSMDSLKSFTLDSRGTPNSGTVSDSGNAAGFYLLGNPYPSQVLWSNLEKTNVANYFYCLDESLQDYAFWDGNAGTGNGKLAGSGGVLNSSQGFLTEMTAAGSLKFEETDKCTGNTSFIRQAKPENLVSFRFLKNNGQVGIENMVHFVAGAENKKDGFDVSFIKSPFKKRYEVKTLSFDGFELCKNTLDLFDKEHEIEILFTPAEAGDYSVNFDGLSELSVYDCVYLEDPSAKKFIDLKSASSYSFYQGSNLQKKFVIRFKKTNGLPDACIDRSLLKVINESNPIASVFSGPSGIIMNFNYQEQTKIKILVYNPYGQLISDVEKIFADGSYIFEKPGVSGIYLVRITDGKKSETHRVFVD